MDQGKTAGRGAIQALAGFLVSGFLFTLVGALLPAWGYDVATDYALAGRYFLAVAAGVILTHPFIRRLPKSPGTRALLVSGSTASALGLAGLALAPPMVFERIAGLLVIGAAAGLLHAGLFQAILPLYEKAPASTVNLGGIFYGAGSTILVLLVAGVYWAYSVGTILLILTVVPAFFGVLYARGDYPPAGLVSHPTVLKQFRSVSAVLFSLLLFFQFGNEWSIASWLPLFLIHSLGISPQSALKFLAFYFISLTTARVVIYYLLPRVRPWRLLGASAAASLFGCGVLAATDNRFGAGVAIALIGIGFASIYPLLASFIGRRFPYYHPGFFNGIFSFGLAGGMLTPWLLGEIAAHVGIWAIMSVPAMGTCMVVLLLGLVWLQGKVTGE